VTAAAYDPSSVSVTFNDADLDAPRRRPRALLRALLAAVGLGGGIPFPYLPPSRRPREPSEEDRARKTRAAAKRARKNAARRAAATVDLGAVAIQFHRLADAERVRCAVAEDPAAEFVVDVAVGAGGVR